MEWQLQDAKNRFSQLVQAARQNGPQTVTVRGEPAAVVLSIKDYGALCAGKPNMVEALLAGPAWDDKLCEDVVVRAKSPSRDVIF